MMATRIRSGRPDIPFSLACASKGRMREQQLAADQSTIIISAWPARYCLLLRIKRGLPLKQAALFLRCTGGWCHRSGRCKRKRRSHARSPSRAQGRNRGRVRPWPEMFATHTGHFWTCRYVCLLSSAPGRSRTLPLLGPEPGCARPRHPGWVPGPSNMGLVPEPLQAVLSTGRSAPALIPVGPLSPIFLNDPVVSGRKSLVTSSRQGASMANPINQQGREELEMEKEGQNRRNRAIPNGVRHDPLLPLTGLYQSRWPGQSVGCPRAPILSMGPTTPAFSRASQFLTVSCSGVVTSWECRDGFASLSLHTHCLGW
ncbi:uncharacterized protein LY79DRAFT_174398 [Colletotrichum navitas]|uniref:Uncharacterized protein n=1 Tax=Colletotrichum navitas TaxID=681940 RepID=A0AAD8Q104_9PEZI|nr:uncharacterized protein LY79DRAFT_174398 [Colletotrichum navitas]KAK1593593.1 hypothetical protein LY79DRAFT_174398 [Colletotrichum navitas]